MDDHAVGVAEDGRVPCMGYCVGSDRQVDQAFHSNSLRIIHRRRTDRPPARGHAAERVLRDGDAAGLLLHQLLLDLQLCVCAIIVQTDTYE